MTAFRLCRTDHGLILTTPGRLTEAERRATVQAFHAWRRQAPDGLLIVDECEWLDLRGGELRLGLDGLERPVGDAGEEVEVTLADGPMIGQTVRLLRTTDAFGVRTAGAIGQYLRDADGESPGVWSW